MDNPEVPDPSTMVDSPSVIQTLSVLRVQNRVEVRGGSTHWDLFKLNTTLLLGVFWRGKCLFEVAH